MSNKNKNTAGLGSGGTPSFSELAASGGREASIIATGISNLGKNLVGLADTAIKTTYNAIDSSVDKETQADINDIKIAGIDASELNNIYDKRRAVATGGLNKQSYLLQVEVKRKELKARHPGFHDTVDRAVNRVVGGDPRTMLQNLRWEYDAQEISNAHDLEMLEKKQRIATDQREEARVEADLKSAKNMGFHDTDETTDDDVQSFLAAKNAASYRRKVAQEKADLTKTQAAATKAEADALKSKAAAKKLADDAGVQASIANKNNALASKTLSEVGTVKDIVKVKQILAASHVKVADANIDKVKALISKLGAEEGVKRAQEQGILIDNRRAHYKEMVDDPKKTKLLSARIAEVQGRTAATRIVGQLNQVRAQTLKSMASLKVSIAADNAEHNRTIALHLHNVDANKAKEISNKYAIASSGVEIARANLAESIRTNQSREYIDKATLELKSKVFGLSVLATTAKISAVKEQLKLKADDQALKGTLANLEHELNVRKHYADVRLKQGRLSLASKALEDNNLNHAARLVFDREKEAGRNMRADKASSVTMNKALLAYSASTGNAQLRTQAVMAVADRKGRVALQIAEGKKATALKKIKADVKYWEDKLKAKGLSDEARGVIQVTVEGMRQAGANIRNGKTVAAKSEATMSKEFIEYRKLDAQGKHAEAKVLLQKYIADGRLAATKERLGIMRDGVNAKIALSDSQIDVNSTLADYNKQRSLSSAITSMVSVFNAESKSRQVGVNLLKAKYAREAAAHKAALSTAKGKQKGADSAYVHTIIKEQLTNLSHKIQVFRKLAAAAREEGDPKKIQELLASIRNNIRKAKLQARATYFDGDNAGYFTNSMLKAELDAGFKPVTEMITNIEDGLKDPKNALNFIINNTALTAAKSSSTARVAAGLTKLLGSNYISLVSSTKGGRKVVSDLGVDTINLIGALTNASDTAGISGPLDAETGVSDSVKAHVLHTVVDLVEDPKTKPEGAKAFVRKMLHEPMGAGSKGTFLTVFTPAVQKRVVELGDIDLLSDFHKGMMDKGEAVVFREVQTLRKVIGSGPSSNGGLRFDVNPHTGEVQYIIDYSAHEPNWLMDKIAGRTSREDIDKALKRFNKVLKNFGPIERMIGERTGDSGTTTANALGLIADRWLGGVLNRVDHLQP